KNAGDITNITDGKAGILQLSPDGSALVVSDKAKSATQVQLGGRTLDGVKDGIVDAQSQQAVNGSQLFNTNQKVDKNTGDITNLTGDITNITNGKAGILQLSPDGSALVISDKAKSATQVQLGGRTLDGVKDGIVDAQSQQAVNGSQLFNTNQKVDKNSADIAKNTGDINHLNTSVQ
ncbi:TPA: hypothetical protein ACPIDV_006101, partial [Pseudomonas aeruginosa]